MIIIIIIIVMIAFKGVIRDFYNLLTAPRTVLDMYAEVARANQMQHIKCLSRAKRLVVCHIVRRDSSAIEFDRV